jgi:YD repeat-containing protein
VRDQLFSPEISQDVVQWKEACAASMLLSRYADMLIMHSVEGWALLPQLIWRFNVYTDPRKPVSVESGIRKFGEPNDMSPVLLTSNFALTYYTVASDIESMKLNCYLLVVDSEGMSVESAVAAVDVINGDNNFGLAFELFFLFSHCSSPRKPQVEIVIVDSTSPDKITSETTSLGIVKYTYDALGRRTSMSPSDEITVNYQYDADGRLIEVSRADLGSVKINYDNARRRTSLILPNFFISKSTYD